MAEEVKEQHRSSDKMTLNHRLGVEEWGRLPVLELGYQLATLPDEADRPARKIIHVQFFRHHFSRIANQ